MSSVDLIRNPKFGREEVGISILMHAADHIWNQERTSEAVDLMDDLRADIQDRIDARVEV